MADIIGKLPDGTNAWVGTPPPNPIPPVTRYTDQTPPAPTTYNGNPIPAKPILGTVDEAAVREDTRKNMQASIDAINANYANLLAKEKMTGQDRSGQTRSINARSGLMGSDFGQAQAEKTTQFNASQEKALADEQNAKIQAVLLNIEDRASAAIKAKKDEALQKYQLDSGEYQKAQEQARADLKILADKGIDLNTLNPAQKAALFKQSGYDDQMGELIYNAMKPKPKQIDYKFEKLADGRGMFYGTDPQTGELKRVDVEVDLPPDWSMQIAPDGTLIGYDKKTGQAKVLSGSGEFGKKNTGFGDLNPAQQSAVFKLADDYEKASGDFKTVTANYNRVLASASNPSAAGDLSLIFAYMKTLDPTSVVREGEFATAAAAGSIPERIWAQYNKVIRGERLSGNQRADFVSRAKGLYSAAVQQQSIIDQTYSERATKFGIDPSYVIRDQTSFNNASSDPDLNNLWDSTGGNKPAVDINKAFKSGGLSFDSVGNTSASSQVKGMMQRLPEMQKLSVPTGTNTKLTSLLTAKYPENSIGGQCGDFVRKVVTGLGGNYPKLGNSLTSKMNAVKNFGTSLANAKIGSVIVTKENPTYGHVAWIIGQNSKGYIVAESNFKQSDAVSYGRIIPYNSNKIIGVINPTKA